MYYAQHKSLQKANKMSQLQFDNFDRYDGFSDASTKNKRTHTHMYIYAIIYDIMIDIRILNN